MKSNNLKNLQKNSASWRTFRIFFIFFLLGEGEPGVRGLREGGGRFFIENPRKGGVSRRGSRGREGVCGELGILGRGG